MTAIEILLSIACGVAAFIAVMAFIRAGDVRREMEAKWERRDPPSRETFDYERGARRRFEAQLETLLGHLGLEVVEQPSRRVVVKKAKQ